MSNINSCPYYSNAQLPYSENICRVCKNYDCPYYLNAPLYYSEFSDYGPEPFVVNIEEVTLENTNFRTTLWTGEHLQVTLMNINVGEDIGFEVHPDLDQFIRIEQGEGLVMMGDQRENLDYQKNVYDDFAFIIPAGKWHNLINTGKEPLKLYSIYAPPQHPAGTVHQTKAEAEAAEENKNH